MNFWSSSSTHFRTRLLGHECRLRAKAWFFARFFDSRSGTGDSVRSIERRDNRMDNERSSVSSLSRYRMINYSFKLGIISTRLPKTFTTTARRSLSLCFGVSGNFANGIERG